jgi:hypothetical protein
MNIFKFDIICFKIFDLREERTRRAGNVKMNTIKMIAFADQNICRLF